jgi:hypothetical protein
LGKVCFLRKTEAVNPVQIIKKELGGGRFPLPFSIFKEKRKKNKKKLKIYENNLIFSGIFYCLSRIPFKGF